MASSQPWDAYESLRIPLQCDDCREDPPYLEHDLSTGDVVCLSCGRVVADHLLDESAEWRNFSNDNDGQAEDKSRVGQAASSLLYGAQLQTAISFPSGSAQGSIGRAHADASFEKANAHLLSVYAHIDTLGSSSSLTGAVCISAKQRYKKAMDKGIWKPTVKSKTAAAQKKQLARIAACLMFACRSENVSRSMKEMQELAGVDRKSFIKAFKECQKEFSKARVENRMETNYQRSNDLSRASSVQVEKTVQPIVSITNTETTRVEELIPRFAHRLSPALPFVTYRKAQDYAAEIERHELLTGRQPGTVAGVCLHLATTDLMDAPSKEEIARVAGISKKTIDKVGALVEPHFKSKGRAMVGQA